MIPAGIFFFGAAVVALSSLVGTGAHAQDYPSRPITIVVPYPPGGPTDTLARIVTERMRTALGQSIIIENVSGAGGNIGVGRVARAAPDGYTFGIGQVSSHVFSGAVYTLQYDLLKDLEPVAMLTTAPMWIIAKNALPANLKGLLDWLWANPDKASFATVGIGGPAHLCGVYFQNKTGTRFQFVPYRGAAPAMQDLLAGQIDLTCLEASNSLPQVRSAKSRPTPFWPEPAGRRRPTFPPSTRRECRDFIFRSGMDFGRREARRNTPSPSSIKRPSRRWPTLQCISGSSTWARKFHRASSRRPRRSASFRRPRSRSGGRSSKQRTLRANKLPHCQHLK